MHVQNCIKADTARCGGRGSWAGRGGGLMFCTLKNAPQVPPVSVFGDVPERSVSSETPRSGRVHPLEGGGAWEGRRAGWVSGG